MFETDDQELSELVGAGLEAILSGDTTVDAFIAQHPEQSADLRLELETALWLVSKQEEVAPRPGFIPASRKRLVARIQEEARSSGARRSIFGLLWPQRPAMQWAAALLALILIFSGTGGLVGFAQSALPGDVLYGIKHASEVVAYALTADELDRVELSAGLAQRRLDETETLIIRKNYQPVAAALSSYEEQVSQTVTLLEKTDEAGKGEAQRNEKRTVAAELKKNLEKHASRLEKLQQNAPEDVRANLQRAEEKALMGAGMASDEARDPNQPTATPLPTETMTATPTSSATPLPSSTVVVSSEKGKPDQDDVASTPKPKGPSDDEKVTNTPRPTNENRPTQKPPEVKPEKKPPKPQQTKDRGNDK